MSDDLAARIDSLDRRITGHATLLHQNAVSIGRLADAAAKNAETIAELNEITANMLAWRDTVDLRDKTIIDKSNEIMAQLVTMEWDRVVHEFAAAVVRLDASTPQQLVQQVALIDRRLRWATLAVIVAVALLFALALILLYHLIAGG